MQIIKEENAQGSAEFILILGGVIVIAIIAAVYYKHYLDGMGNAINSTDVQNINNALNGLNDKFK
jgi:uncharacterized protein (UPF0333 family)